MKQEELAAIKARNQARTQGDWQHQRGTKNFYPSVYSYAEENDMHPPVLCLREEPGVADIAFILNSGKDITALLAEIDRLSKIEAAAKHLLLKCKTAYAMAEWDEAQEKMLEALRHETIL